MRQVYDHTYVLGSSGHNFFVVIDRDEATVIDAGCSREWRKLVGGLESIGVPVEAVAGIVATHSHADHFGFAKEAKTNGVPVSVHEDEESRALGTYQDPAPISVRSLPIFRLHTLKTFLPMIMAGVLRLEHLDQVGTFKDGERLDLPGRPVAVHTPGHTEGHTMFHIPESGLLFTGDGLITKDLLGPKSGPQMIDRRFNLDHEMAMSSLDRIVGLDANLLLPGHGAPWVGRPADAVALARS